MLARDARRPRSPSNDRHDDLIAARLIARYQGGDLSAFVLLHERYRELVYRIALARLHCTQDAEDVTQLVFLKLFEILDAGRIEWRSFRRWLSTVARNAAEDHSRKSSRCESVAPDRLDRWRDAAPGSAPAAWGDTAAVHALIGELSRSERQLIELRYRCAMDPRETGAVLGRSEGAVYKLQGRTLAKLRTSLVAR
jgi:RNA polymerase sigma-70 factor (ECF subfamily)